jgi:nucleoside-diphosphate-sugar epimerase
MVGEKRVLLIGGVTFVGSAMVRRIVQEALDRRGEARP